MSTEELSSFRERLLLAFLEEKCHLHPTAEVVWEEDYIDDFGRVYTPRIGGFDAGCSIAVGDLLDWLIETDQKPSEVKNYFFTDK